VMETRSLHEHGVLRMENMLLCVGIFPVSSVALLALAILLLAIRV